MSFSFNLTKALAPIALFSVLAGGCQITVKTTGEAPAVTGDWDTEFEAITAGQRTKTGLNLVHVGNSVTGRYLDGATLEGSLNDHVLRGAWHNAGKNGTFEFTFSGNFRTFNGTWITPEEVGKSYAWNGSHR